MAATMRNRPVLIQKNVGALEGMPIQIESKAQTEICVGSQLHAIREIEDALTFPPTLQLVIQALLP